MAAFDQLRHLPEEEGQQQRADMRAINVGISHDNDAVVSQLVWIKFILADAAPQGGDQGADFCRAQHFIESRLFNIENFALQRENGLKPTVSTLLRRATSRIPLDQIQFTQGGISLLTISQLAGQPRNIQRTLAASHIACFARGLSGAGGVNHLANH